MHKSDSWLCRYCQAKFAHNQSAASHFNKCEGLEKMIDTFKLSCDPLLSFERVRTFKKKVGKTIAVKRKVNVKRSGN